MRAPSLISAALAALFLSSTAAQAAQVNLNLDAIFSTTNAGYVASFYGPASYGTSLIGSGQLQLDFDPTVITHYPVHTHVSGIGYSTQDWYVIPLNPTSVTGFSFTVGNVSWSLADLIGYQPNATLAQGIYLAGSATTPSAVALSAINAAGDQLNFQLAGCSLQSCALDGNGMTSVNPKNITTNLYAVETAVATAVQPAPIVSAVPEPGSVVLLLGGLSALAALRKRRIQPLAEGVSCQ